MSGGKSMVLVYPQIITGADLLRGINKLNYVAPLLKRRGATAAAVVNSKLYGVPSFYKVMKKYDINPVIGLSVRVEIEEESALLYVYAKNEEGYRNLLKMSSAISITDSAILPLQWLDAYSAGCIVVCPMTHKSWDEIRTEETLNSVINNSKQAEVYIGIARPSGVQHIDEPGIEKIAETMSLRVTAVYESRFADPEDSFAYEVAQAIRTGKKLSERTGLQMEYKESYLPEENELETWFSNRPTWLENIASLLASCSVEIKNEDFLMPKFPITQEESALSYLEKKCTEGLVKRIGNIEEIYRNRLAYEISVIHAMDFTDYFLIVEDFMRFAADNHILTGPGRGSSAGSLVAFALGITDVDPIKFGLVFERFLNPERITMPDIDIDFADNRRMEVIEYVAQKYGKTHVSQIITFGTLSARAVARNVARVFGFTTEEMAYLSSIIPNRLGITLEAAFEESNQLREWIAMDPLRGQWFQAAKSLEGLPRNASTHAAGVVLSPKPLVEIVPLQDGGEGIYLTQWPMGDVENQGLLKMDFLGLRNLTLLDRIRSMIHYDKGILVNFEQFPLDDVRTYELFRNGDMTGIFQFESDGMRETLKLIQPNRFEDLYAINALYRPGPMDNIPVYHRRKHGQENISYIHPSLEPILAETYGVIVYQEQIMQIAVEFARYTMGEADLLRRAISKKNRDVLNAERAKFTQRAVANGVPEQNALSIYELIVKFADYGFPKSHAVAYSLISYRLAFLKAHEPAYFYAALLSSTTGNNDKTVELMREAEARGITFLPPSVKRSKFSFAVEKGSIRIGLSSIKGITLNFYNMLRNVRNNGGNWKTMFDFAAALGGENFTEKIAGQLIKAGACDEFGEPRAVLLASIDAAISHALFIGPNDSDDLLASAMLSIASPKYTPSGQMPRMKMLEYEREVLGFYLSEHPVSELKKRSSEEIHDALAISDMHDRMDISIIGLITEIKRIRTKKGESMAFVKVQDETSTVSCTFFPRQYASFNVHLTEMTMILIQGTVEKRRGAPQILVQQVKKIEETYE